MPIKMLLQRNLLYELFISNLIKTENISIYLMKI